MTDNDPFYSRTLFSVKSYHSIRVTFQSRMGASGNMRGKGSCWMFNAKWSRTAFRCATASTWRVLRVCRITINVPRVRAPASK
jgi:hypothetical protein